MLFTTTAAGTNKQTNNQAKTPLSKHLSLQYCPSNTCYSIAKFSGLYFNIPYENGKNYREKLGLIYGNLGQHYARKKETQG